MLDTRIHLQTPEGIELALTPAGLLPRGLAWLLDTLIKVVLYIAADLIFVNVLSVLGDGLLLIVMFVLFWLYNVLFEVFYYGQTPGKKVMGIRVMRSNGAPVKFTASLLRNLIRVVDFLPFAYLIGILSTLFTKSFSRLGDLVADTVVAYDETAGAVSTPDFNPAMQLPIALKASDHHAVMLYAERLDSLTAERAVELASQLKEHIDGSPEAIRDRLRSHAAWLSGEQT
ncbi:MAG: RDD family protein [Gammaproteobacteria bacterium]